MISVYDLADWTNNLMVYNVFIQKGRAYRTCVQSVMVYASETWAVRVEEEPTMERKENAMLRWICEVTLRDKVPTVERRRRLGIEGVVKVMRRGRLRWFGHVERKEVGDWVSACGSLEMAGSRGGERLGEYVWMGI